MTNRQKCKKQFLDWVPCSWPKKQHSGMTLRVNYTDYTDFSTTKTPRHEDFLTTDLHGVFLTQIHTPLRRSGYAGQAD